jgi:AraC-like DNA-binding protein
VSVDGEDPAETFCLFFQRGVVEEIGRVLTTGDAALLDSPEAGPAERTRGARCQGRGIRDFEVPTFLARDVRLLEPLRQAHRLLTRGTPPGPWLEERILSLGESLLRIGSDVRREIAGVPAARASTRIELFRRLRRAVDRIEGSLDQPLSLEEVARAACLSPYHFHRLFTETHGETPHHFVRRRRLERARERLERSQDSVTDICLDCGFASVTSFSALFRRRFGLPPARYRRAHRENGKNGDDRAGRSRYLGRQEGEP